MPLLTVAEVKSILQIDTDNDLLIETLIPIALEHFHALTRNYFLDVRVQYVGSPLQFNSGTKKITRLIPSGGSFTDYNFAPGYYKVTYSLLNDGVIEVSNVTADELTCVNDLKNETTDSSVIITRVNYPNSLKVDLALYIGKLLDKSQANNIKSESLPGGYSVTYDDKSIDDRLFAKYRIPY